MFIDLLVNGCVTRVSGESKAAGITFHLILKDAARRAAGQHEITCRRSGYQPTTWNSLCSQHFTDSSFKSCDKHRMLKDVVPTSNHLQPTSAKKRRVLDRSIDSSIICSNIVTYISGFFAHALLPRCLEPTAPLLCFTAQPIHAQRDCSSA